MNPLLIIIALVVGFVLGRVSKKKSTPFDSPEKVAQLQKSAKQALNERTEDRKEKILQMMAENKEHHAELKACNLEIERKGINREDVEELLSVSKHTALNYLDELEDEGKIRQIGKGRGVYYTLA